MHWGKGGVRSAKPGASLAFVTVVPYWRTTAIGKLAQSHVRRNRREICNHHFRFTASGQGGWGGELGLGLASGAAEFDSVELLEADAI